MKVIILVAGVGSRLSHSDQPKCLAKLVNGQSILAFQLENLARYLPPKDVILVVGYQKERIQEQFADLAFVENPRFAEENTAKSLERALKGIEEDVLWLNGDVVFHHTILESVLAHRQTVMVVNRAAVGEEEVKYRADGQGNILEVSKEVTNSQGEALGINFFTKEDLVALKKNLKLCEDHDYFEKAIERCIQEGLQISCVTAPFSQCTEVDFPEDLQRANNLITSWKYPD